MSATRPVYLLAPEGTEPGLEALIPGRQAARLATASELQDLPPGLLLIAEGGVGSDEVLKALVFAASAPPEAGWLPVLVLRTDNGASLALPISIGWPAEPEELARWAAGAVDADVLELRHVLTRVGRGRHDLNNPLTSALAETQLALMDTHDPTVRQGLETVEEQLRRIRDLVSALRSLRPPL